MPGFLGEYTIQHAHNLSQVDSIFVFCGNVKRHEQWTKYWPRIKGVFTEITSICEALKQAANQCERNAIPLSFLSLNKKLDKLDPSFMYTRILKDIVLNMDFEEQHVKEYADYCREVFANNREKLMNIDTFENEYRNKTSIWWYTYQDFLSSMLNRSLRLMDLDIIIRMSFFIRDLHQNIDKLYGEQFSHHYSLPSFTVYRGQGLSKTDFEQILQTQGELISFNSFLLTSKSRTISFACAQSAAMNPDLVGVLFVMEIDSSLSTTPFASIREVSYSQTEDEVLFSIHSVFRIHDIKSLTEQNRLYEVVLTIISDDEDLRALTYSIRKEISSSEGGWKPLALMLEKIGQFDKAEEVYRVLLERTTYELGKGSLYHALGRINYNQGKYHEAIIFHDKAIHIYQEHLSPTNSSLFEIYNNIGLAYGAIDDYLTALSYFENAVAIRQESLTSDHSDLAYPYNNIGNVYYNMGDYSQALSFHEKALAIQQESLPANHPHLAMSYNDIGVVYENMKNYSKAHSYFERATEIAQHSLPSNHPELLKYRQQLEHLKTKL